MEQQYVFHVMDYALCLSESKQKSCEKHVNRGGKPTSKSGALSLSVHSLYSLLLIAISYAVFVALEAEIVNILASLLQQNVEQSTDLNDLKIHFFCFFFVFVCFNFDTGS